MTDTTVRDLSGLCQKSGMLVGEGKKSGHTMQLSASCVRGCVFSRHSAACLFFWSTKSDVRTKVYVKPNKS